MILVSDFYAGVITSSDQVQKRFQCLKCDKSYKLRSDLRRHMTVQCGKLPQEHCPYCAFCTYYRFNLKKHIGVTHGINTG